MKQEILYAVSSSVYYQHMVGYSIQSIRSFSKNMPVRLCVYGRVSGVLRKLQSEDRQLTIVELQQTNMTFGPVLKWAALGQCVAENVLFADADTFFLSSPKGIFDRYRKIDICAEVERATDRAWRRGNHVIKKRINDKVMSSLLRRYGSRKTFVPFSGLMLFNNNSAKTVAKEIPLIFELFTGFKNGEIKYPCDTPYMADEVAAGLVFGRLRGIKFGHFHQGAITHLIDWLPNPGDMGAIMHTGHELADQGFEFFGMKKKRAILLGFDRVTSSQFEGRNRLKWALLIPANDFIGVRKEI